LTIHLALCTGAPSGGSLRALFALFSMLGGSAGPRLDEEALRALVVQARDGDPGAQRRLYEQLVDRVFRAVRPMFQDEAEAEDVTQDALIKVLSSLGSYRPRPGSSFVSWVLAVAVNTGRRRFRRRRPLPTEPEVLAVLQESVASADGPCDEVERQRTRALVLRALWEVPERERQVLSLRYGAELNASEIAPIVGLKPAHVRKICERWRPRLAARIEALQSPPEPSHA
jgi:RNA polymerase sigma-70 factor (ECF subfamily)